MNARPFSAAFLTLELARKVPAIVDVLSRYRSLRGFERYRLFSTVTSNGSTVLLHTSHKDSDHSRTPENNVALTSGSPEGIVPPSPPSEKKTSQASTTIGPITSGKCGLQRPHDYRME